MNIFYFFQNYLNKLNDTMFKIKWEKFVYGHMKRFIIVLVIFWVVVSAGFGYLASLIIGSFFAIVFMIIFSIYIGYVLFIQSVRFLAINNSRYVERIMNEDESVVNYDNVVG